VPFISAAQGWQRLVEKINKNPKDARHYQAIKLVNGMMVLLVSDAQAQNRWRYWRCRSVRWKIRTAI